MKIISKRFDTELDIDDDKIIHMPWGIPGFGESKRFCILEMEDPLSPFKWLHDCDNTDICFLITDPFHFFPQYKPQINEAAIEDLDIRDVTTELTIFTIVKITRGGKEAFTNLRAPVVVNTVTKKSRQVILESDEYGVKTPLFSQTEETRAAVNA
ncbi:MAG: flagellar assembly protein FliW [Deltaproteobacteria bacterium]|nr:flagellar assembly protein FliW [Deltaproteobacteria bacterium]